MVFSYVLGVNLQNKRQHSLFRCGMWVASIGVHDDISVQEVAPEMDPMEREHMTALMDTSEIAADNTFLKAKVGFRY